MVRIHCRLTRYTVLWIWKICGCRGAYSVEAAESLWTGYNRTALGAGDAMDLLAPVISKWTLGSDDHVTFAMRANN